MAHASFMDDLVDDGFIVMGGPLDDGHHALLVVEAADEPDVRARMAADPWAVANRLHVGAVQRWSIWLDGRARSSAG